MNKNLLFLPATLLLVSIAGAQTQQTTTVSKTVETTPGVTTQNVEQSKTFTGKLSGVDPSLLTLSLSSEDSSSPLRYSYTTDTKFYDSDGHALTPESLESGSSITLTYVQAGTTLVAVKAILSKPVETVRTEGVVVEQAAPGTVTSKTTIVKPSPALEETTTTTTTTQP